MTSDNENRVLMRRSARALSGKEINQVTGGLIPTRLTLISTNAGADQSLDT